MRLPRIALAVAAGLLAHGAQAQTVAVSGNLRDVAAGTVASSVQVDFELQNYGGNIPVVSGTGAIVEPKKTFKPNASGDISGTVYANNQITPAQTWYRVCIIRLGQTFRCANYTINSNFNLNSPPPAISAAAPPSVTQAVPRSYIHSQTAAAATWTVTHGFANQNVIATFFDNASPRQQIFPDTVRLTDVSTLTATFTLAQAGIAIVMTAGNVSLASGSVALADVLVKNPNANQSIAGNFGLSFDTGTIGKLNNVRVVDGVKFTTIVAALGDLPPSGGLVHVPAGTYAEQPVIAKSNVTLLLDANAVIAPTAAGAGLTIGDGTTATYKNIRVVGGQIKPSGASPTRGIYIRGAAVGGTVQHIFIETTVDCSSATNAAFDGIFGDGVQDNITIGPHSYVFSCLRDGYSFQSASITNMNEIKVYGRANGNSRYGVYGTLITGFHFSGAESATAASVAAARALRFEGINTGSVVSATLRSNVLTAFGNVVTAEFVNNGATNTSGVAVVGSYIDGDPASTGGRVQLTTSNNIVFMGNTFVSQASGSTVRVTGTVFGIVQSANVNWSIDTPAALGDLAQRRYKASGTALVAGDFALSAGWGTTATVTSARGTDQFFELVVTSAGTGQGANPTITHTPKDGTWTTAPVWDCFRQERTSQPTVTLSLTTQTATSLVIQFNGTPIAAETYKIGCHTGGI